MVFEEEKTTTSGNETKGGPNYDIFADKRD